MAEGFEYLDHTADIQLHAWAPTQRRAFELVAQAMFGYITDLEHVEETGMPVEVEATGHDMEVGGGLGREVAEAVLRLLARACSTASWTSCCSSSTATTLW